MPEGNYDLEERTFLFAKEVRPLIKKLPVTLANKEDAKQLIRCSASIGANESLSKKDFIYRAKLSRKEAKESIFFLRLLDVSQSEELEKNREQLRGEATQLMKILDAMITNST